jgi:glycosyltransferase involved in cell wall biosynthesis
VRLTFTARKNGPVSKELPNLSEVVIIPKKSGFDLIYLKRLVRLVRERNIDIIHSHLFGPNLFGFLAAKLTRRKIIQTIHGRDCLATRKRIVTYKHMSPWVDRIVTVSELLEQEFRNKVRKNRIKLTTIHNGINLARFATPIDKEKKLKLLELPTNSTIIGAVGNVKPVKGYDVLIESFRILQTKVPNSVLLITGEIFPKHETYKIYLDSLIRQYKLEDKVFYLGYRSDVAEILKLFDVYVMSSRSEGLSVSLLEAMAAERPVVATDVGLNRHVIRDGVNGLVVPSENPKALAEALSKTLIYPDMAKTLGQKAIETVRDRFSDDVMGRRYQELYNEIADWP